jgi:hypothetical protein
MLSAAHAMIRNLARRAKALLLQGAILVKRVMERPPARLGILQDSSRATDSIQPENLRSAE